MRENNCGIIEMAPWHRKWHRGTENGTVGTEQKDLGAKNILTE